MSRGASRRPSIAVAAVALLAGILFATSASVFAGTEDGQPRDLRDLVATERDRLEQRNNLVEGLRTEVTALQADGAVELAAPTRAEATALGLDPITGRGIAVTLNDAPPSSTSANPDDLVVHQQDLQSVVNALWVGGAEAIMIQDQRVVATSAVRCIGNVLLLHGRTYSPPYVIRAIGDPDALRQAVTQDDGVELFLQYVDAYGLGWGLTTESQLVLPAYTGTRTLNFASPLKEIP